MQPVQLPHDPYLCNLKMKLKDTMVKKMKLPSIFKNQETKSTSWKWHPFRLGAFQVKVNTCINVYLALCHAAKFMGMLDSSWSKPKTISLTPKEPKEDLLEIAVNKAIRSKRLFFEPGNTSSILENHDHGEANKFPFPECVALTIESEDPYVDFRNSMVETVETCGVKNWEDMEELLAWYLRMNRKQHHCFIIEAFVDLFSSAPSSCFSCPISYSDSASSSKSEDWWVIEANKTSQPSIYGEGDTSKDQHLKVMAQVVFGKQLSGPGDGDLLN